MVLTVSIVVPPYVFPSRNTPNVTPLTYRDGITYLQKLELLRVLINKVNQYAQDSNDEMVAIVVQQINSVISDVNSAISSALDQVNDAVQSIIDESIEVQDSVIAGAVADQNSQTRTQLNSVGYPILRVWDGAAYPPRVDGALNIFVGTIDPGLAMDPATDFWMNLDVTTLASVVAEMADTSSALYAAARTSMENNPIPLVPTYVPNAAEQINPNNVTYGIPLNDGATNQLRSVVRIPDTWTKGRIFVLLSSGPDFTAAGNVRLIGNFIHLPVSGSPSNPNGAVNATLPVSTANTLYQVAIAGGVNVTPGAHMEITCGRQGGSTADTYVGKMWLMAAWLVKAA